MKKQSGFTLIELIVVIVILGILAATAMPKFFDVATQARTAAVTGVKGAMDSAASLAHASQMVAGAASSTAAILGGVSITMSNGYPTADATGIQVAAGLNSADYTIVAGPPFDVEIKNSPTATSCKASYTASVAGATPVTSTTVTGC